MTVRSDRIGFLPGYPLPTVRLDVEGIRFTFAVDTGSVGMVISSRVAADLNIDLTRPARWERLAGVGVSAPVPVVYLSRVVVAGVARTNLLAYVYDLPSVLRVDGLLGLNFLSRFRVTFEFDTRTLVLRSV